MNYKQAKAVLLCMTVSFMLCACATKQPEQNDSFSGDGGAFQKSIETDMAKFKESMKNQSQPQKQN